jgi:hypothetical protein
MTCRTVRNSLSAHIDGRLSGTEKLEVARHLSECHGCTAQMREMTRIRRAVRRLPAAAPPPDLTGVLRIIASREHSRRVARSQPWRRVADRLQLWVDNLMRPMALPFAGGLVSAVLLFAMLIPSFTIRRSLANDVPVGWFTEAAVATPDPFGFPDSDCVVEAIVDGQGRVIDYRIQSGDVPDTPELRRQIENKLLFISFKPATAFGQPTYSKVYLYFNRTHVNVQS